MTNLAGDPTTLAYSLDSLQAELDLYQNHLAVHWFRSALPANAPLDAAGHLDPRPGGLQLFGFEIDIPAGMQNYSRKGICLILRRQFTMLGMGSVVALIDAIVLLDGVSMNAVGNDFKAYLIADGGEEECAIVGTVPAYAALVAPAPGADPQIDMLPSSAVQKVRVVDYQAQIGTPLAAGGVVASGQPQPQVVDANAADGGYAGVSQWRGQRPGLSRPTVAKPPSSFISGTRLISDLPLVNGAAPLSERCAIIATALGTQLRDDYARIGRGAFFAELSSPYGAIREVNSPYPVAKRDAGYVRKLTPANVVASVPNLTLQPTDLQYWARAPLDRSTIYRRSATHAARFKNVPGKTGPRASASLEDGGAVRDRFWSEASEFREIASRDLVLAMGAVNELQEKKASWDSKEPDAAQATLPGDRRGHGANRYTGILRGAEFDRPPVGDVARTGVWNPIPWGQRSSQTQDIANRAQSRTLANSGVSDLRVIY